MAETLSDKASNTSVPDVPAQTTLETHSPNMSSNREPPFDATSAKNYILARIEEYEKTTKDTGVILCMFQDDFEKWTPEMFDLPTKTTLADLRTTLIHAGLRVEKFKNKQSLRDSLVELLDQDEPITWTKIELLDLVKNGTAKKIQSSQLLYLIQLAKDNDPIFDQTDSNTPNTSTRQSSTPQPYREENPVQPAYIPERQHESPKAPSVTPQPDIGLGPPQRTTYPTSYRFKTSPHQTPQPEPYKHKLTPYQTPIPPPPPPIHVENDDQEKRITRTAREMGSLVKLYTENMKYGAAGDNFGQKLNVFYNACRRAGVPNSSYALAFPTMLKGAAESYYYSTLMRQDLSFEQLCYETQTYFEDATYQRAVMEKWNNFSLKTVKQRNPDKPIADCFEIFVENIRVMYNSLTPDLQTEVFHHVKIMTGCQGFKHCHIALSQPPPKVNALITAIRSSIEAYENTLENSETFMADRRFQFRKYDNDKRDNRFKRDKQDKRCFVCNKRDCWSTTHPESEQQAARNRFKSNHGHRFDTRSKSHFDKVVRQYITRYEGNEQEAIDRKLDDIFLTRDNSDGPSEEGSPEKSEDDRADVFFTSLGSIPLEIAQELTSNLCDQAFLHSLTAKTEQNPTEERPEEIFMSARYHNEYFFGIMIDTGAAEHSSVGLGQYQAYNSSRRTPITLPNTSQKFKFGIGTTTSKGIITISSPVGTVDFHLVDADVPFLLSLADMDRLGIYYNNVRNVLVGKKEEFPVIRKHGHPFLVWNEFTDSFVNETSCYLTETELRRLHKRFGHPSVARLQETLEKAGHEVDSDILKHLTKFCKFCQKHGKSPGRFHFTIHDDVDFNYCIYIDIMYIDNQPVLHIVDEATRYQAGRWLENISTKHVWEKLQECWINTYLGPPDLLVHDAGKSFMSREFKFYAKNQGISTKDVPVEAHNSIGIVERYHGPVRRAYKIITEELPELNKDSALQMAFKAINDISGPDGLVPTLLVFGAYPRMTENDAPSPTVQQRSTALRKAMNEVQKARAKRQVADALNQRNGQKTHLVKGLPLNSPVLVFREVPGANKAGRWTGPYSLVSMDKEECVVELPSGPTKFRSTVVKPYYSESSEESNELDEPDHPDELGDSITVEHPSSSTAAAPDPPTVQTEEPVRRRRGRPRNHPLPTANATIVEMFLGEPAKTPPFEASRLEEINGLLEREVFEFIKEDELPDDVRLFGSRFVDEVKNKDTDKELEKSRLVIQAYNDLEKIFVLTQSPTIQRISQRILLAATALFPEFDLCLRDITQAYTQSTTRLNRDFFARPPKEIPQWQGLYLKVVKPLYGVPEAGNHWFGTYHKHHMEKLRLSQSTFDPCLLFANKDSYFGLVGLQTDDTLFLGSKEFLTTEEEELHKAGFTAKERELLSNENPIKFNGGKVQREADGSVLLTQEMYHKNLRIVGNKPIDITSSRGNVRTKVSTRDQYVSQRARGAYLATVSQPEAAFDLSFAAQSVNPTKEDIRLLNKRIKWQIENSQRGLRFVKLDRSSLKLVVFTDSSFANNKDLTSQIGYVIVLMDKDDNANLLHWSSTKCKRVTRSVLAAELYAMAHGYDMTASVKSTIECVLDMEIPLAVCTDSKSLYECLVKLGTTNEKRLMIDLMCLRQAYECREISEIKWIDGNSNPADAMTKSTACSALKVLIDTNRIRIKATEWVERGLPNSKFTADTGNNRV